MLSNHQKHGTVAIWMNKYEFVTCSAKRRSNVVGNAYIIAQRCRPNALAEGFLIPYGDAFVCDHNIAAPVQVPG